MSPHSRVTLRQLAVRRSDDDPGAFVVGRPERGEFVELPEVGVEAIRLLGTGLTVEQVEDRLASGEDRPDVAGLLAELVDLSWVASLDGQALPDPAGTRRVRLGWLRPDHLRWLFGRPATVCHAALLAAAVAAVARRPDLLPSYHDFFWTDYVGLATLVNTLMFLTGALVHELLHLAAARSLDLPARLGVGTRLNNLALQTDVSAAWALPRRRRYRIYLAGLAWDTAAVSTALLVLAHAGPPEPVRGLLAAYVLVATVGMAFQAQVWMRTDLYFVLMDLLRCRDLFHDGLAYARYASVRASRALRRRPAPPDPSRDLPPGERRAVRVYAPLLVVGSTAALGAYAVFGVPVLVATSARALSALADLPGGSVPHAVDGGLVLAVEWGLQAAFLAAFYRSHPAWFRWGNRERGGGDQHA